MVVNFAEGARMPIRVQELLPLSEAGSRLAELADDVVAGAEKVLTKDGVPFVAIIDARKLAYYRALEAEHGRLVMLDDAANGLKDALSGSVRSEDEFRNSVGRSQPRD
jgi:antitoxin (DNA-binding transcriptional repressor) of toxin-antitoxin stability system